MPEILKVKAPPPKPLLLYDGDCLFCCRWTERWKNSTGDLVDRLPLQDETVSDRFPEISRDELDEAIHLVQPSGAVYRGAEAVFQALADSGRDRWLLWLYHHVYPFANLCEVIYCEVSSHRSSLSKVDQIYSGPGCAISGGIAVRWLFLRGLALIYLAAFFSLWVQIHGLVGAHGISPAEQLISAVKQELSVNGVGAARYHIFPTFAWWSASDRSLDIQCGLGVLAAAMLLFGIAPAPMLFLLWAVYLSLCTVSAPFLDFQWDNLLLETGFIAIFYAPRQWVERPSLQAQPSGLMLFLLRWLLFRLMFESGCVKLLSGDLSWWDLSALNYHFQTQPLPTWLGWFAHQMPGWLEKTSVLVMLLIELVVPALIFCGRRLRLLAIWPLAALQVAILLTGNYGFFNYLTLLLCLTLLDDRALLWHQSPPPCPVCRWPWPGLFALWVTVLIATTIPLLATMGVPQHWPRPVLYACEWLEPFRSFNEYGLFRVMTRERPEIILEGSNDGKDWRPYPFKYKPGALNARPRFVAPYQPRLDWQMWFAALSDPRHEPWFLRLELRLLQGSPEVSKMLASNPFPQSPPKYLRAQLYYYTFTTSAERKNSGDWWKRKFLRPYVPALTLADFGPAAGNR